MSQETAVDQRLFRDITGRFATGVTVVTLQVDGETRGMTANAFTSVSLDPPLVLVCVQRNATAHELFERADSFGVNILSDQQREVSDVFAQHGPHDQPMAGVPCREGVLGCPMLQDSLAWLECRITERLEGGDHTIVLGEVVDLGMQDEDGQPLVFFRGKYHQLGGQM